MDGLTVAWLMAVPIADSEVEFARLNGTQRLQEIFEQEQIDVFDIDRAPVL
ncbi:MAG: suppressor of fused domain protein [Geodermatophilaceae bacterium]